MRSLRKGRSHIGYEIEANGQCNQTDDEGLDDVTLRKRQHDGEEIEHACQRSQWQELVAWQYNGQT